MKLRLKNIPAAYFNSWWIPFTVCVVLLTALMMTRISWMEGISEILYICLLISFPGVLFAGIWNIFKKRWLQGIVNLVLFLVCAAASLITIVFLPVCCGPGEDEFADSLIIPADVEAVESMSEIVAAPGGPEDGFQQDLLTALSSPGSNDPTVTANVNALLKLNETSPDILIRFLATSPSWRIFKEHGNRFATRRWMIGSQWKYNLHGYYTRGDIDKWQTEDIPEFQSRFTIGFSGEPWAGPSGDASLVDAGQTLPIKLSSGNRMYESRCIINAGTLVVEVFEQSEAKERRLTKAALSHIEKELSLLLIKPHWSTIHGILDGCCIRTGNPVFNLRNSFQPGIYDSEIWLNPGEPGMIYLKAFEVTKKTPLSVKRLKDRSNEWIGWSDDPSQLFFSNTHFTIYEGDWDKPYAARFEIWFTPDSGKPDRKLMEKTFKIEGWQR